MTILDLHIDFNTKLQINNPVLDQLGEDDVDWWLNIGQYKVIKTRLNPALDPRREGFDSGIDRIEDLSNLVKTETIDLRKLDSNSMYAPLPSDYLYLMNSSVSLLRSCDAIDFTSIEETVNTYTAYRFELPASSADPVYQEWAIEVGGSSFISNDTFGYTDGLNDEAEKILIIAQILHWSKINGIDAYWEWYDGTYYSNQIIMAGNGLGQVSIDIDGGALGGGTTTLATQVVTAYTGHSVTANEESPVRLVNPSNVRDMIKHPFATTRYDSPLMTRRDRNFIVYHQGKFAPDTITLEYIRKPAPISLKYNITSELPANEVVDQAVASYSGRIVSFNYQTIAQDTVFGD